VPPLAKLSRNHDGIGTGQFAPLVQGYAILETARLGPRPTWE
jgi:hypothetical protein